MKKYELKSLGAVIEALRDGAKVFMQSTRPNLRGNGTITRTYPVEIRETNRYGLQPCVCTSRPSVYFRVTNFDFETSREFYAEV